MRGQLAKCAEAGAWRIAFPEQLGGEMTFDEIEGQPSLVEADSRTPTAGALAGMVAEKQTEEPKSENGNTTEEAAGEKAEDPKPAAAAPEELANQFPWEVWPEPTDDQILALCSGSDSDSFFESLDKGVRSEGGSAHFGEWAGQLKTATKNVLKSGLVAYRKSNQG